jgi:HK97 family phage portal protein
MRRSNLPLKSFVNPNSDQREAYMKAWLKRLSLRATHRKGLDLPMAPPGPPPFLNASGLGGRARQLAAYQGWVFAAVNAIAQRVAGLPLKLYREGGAGPEVTSHPALDLLARPNPLMTRRQLRFTLVTHLELTGMAFLLMADNALGRPAELWPLLPSDLIEIATGHDTRQPITGFVFSGPRGERLTYGAHEIIYLRHPSPVSLVYGASPIEAAAHAFDIDLAVRVYQRNFFRNAARPEVVLQTDQRLTEEEARRLLTRWNQKHQGLAHVFEPTLLDNGLKAQPLTYSAKDFEFMALASWTQDNLLAAFGVPAAKLGLVKDVNRANAQALDVTFNSECVRPRLDLIEDALNAFLLPRYGNGLALRHDNPVPGDRAQEHRQAMERLDRGVLTVNEVRAGLGLAPVAWGDKPYAPPQAQPTPQAAPGAAPVDEPLPLSQPTSAAPAPPIRDLLAQAAPFLRAHWPALEGRFAGWSPAKVRYELKRKPQLLAGLIPAGAPADQASCLRTLLTDSLARGLSLDQAFNHITSL